MGQVLRTVAVIAVMIYGIIALAASFVVGLFLTSRLFGRKQGTHPDPSVTDRVPTPKCPPSTTMASYPTRKRDY
jgi:hypothetical protein